MFILFFRIVNCEFCILGSCGTIDRDAVRRPDNRRLGARLGSAEPTPGGGAAAALLAKLGASLVQMVGRHTVGRPKYAAIEGKVQAAIDEAERLDARAGELMDADGD